MKTKLLFLMAMLVSSTMTWAQTAPEGLSIDTDYSPGEEGYYYVNMPHQSNSSIEFTSTDLVFKVYDNGGKNGNYGNASSDRLQLQAPIGCCFEV